MFFFFQAEDGIRDTSVTGVQTCALPISSAAASSAYLTVSEIFPLEVRALAIAIFFAIGTLTGGVGAPVLFGWIIGTGSITALFTGYLVAAALMIFGACVEVWIGVPAERRSLEHVATPLSSRGL